MFVSLEPTHRVGILPHGASLVVSEIKLPHGARKQYVFCRGKTNFAL